MIVTADKRERDIIAKHALENGLKATFYTVESNENLLRVEIDTNDPAIAWHLGNMVGSTVMSKASEDIVKRLI